MADGLEAALQGLKDLLLAEIRKLLAEALEVAEGMLVNEADEAEQFEQRVLQGRGREQQLGTFLQRLLERVGDDVRGLVDIAEAVGFVNHHEVPSRVRDVGGLACGRTGRSR